MTEEELRPEADQERVELFGYNKRKVQLTPELVEIWMSGVRLLWKSVLTLHNGNEAQAWASVYSKIRELHPDVGPDDLSWALPILTGERDVTEAEGTRMLDRFPDRTPLIDALRAVLGG